METYILKAVACSSILIAIYYLFLSKEKSFQFNRFYLLFALLFSYLIPIISLKLPAKEELKSAIVFQNAPTESIILSGKPPEAEINWAMIILSIYGIVVLFLLAKSIFSVLKIFKLKGEKRVYNDLKIKVLDNQMPPFSFFGRLYLGKNYFKNEKIDERIFLHEKNHIEQKHSLDLILIEFLRIFSWFNPALYVYKKAIITNHEFLADEDVISQNFEIKSYQELILNEISSSQNLQFTNQFNFSNTKKRFIMMTKTKSKFTQVKKLLTLPVLALLAFLFVQKTYAKTNSTEKMIENLPKKLPSIKSYDTQEVFQKEFEAPKSDTIKKPTKKVESQNPPPPPPKEVSVKKNNTEYVMPPPPPTSALTEVDELPEFPGGINAFRSQLSKTFNVAILTGKEGMIKSEIYFVVEKDGTISDVSAAGSNEMFNNEAIRATKSSNEDQTWKPAVKDGKPVRYRFRLPLTMSF
ncbi:M56 family metallopeptidase [Frigoriflavimonas asaccharolytica]|uniref:Beta-lactamase regulating signal transducer with metallopeptidase domain n=1 Tax=Frigoriflavimonas asaccharolytica TaxID=2735899 RepID=A0A8J8K7P0_9FLAO|nr:M56 family metallopeptidase [Frigoriflavimonas asaccharolytica]NRS91142.1 beta-lactamase regulating signal transducer with metallopeptidase domain [Frigoriflavimonas asaccharolytica]